MLFENKLAMSLPNSRKRAECCYFFYQENLWNPAPSFQQESDDGCQGNNYFFFIPYSEIGPIVEDVFREQGDYGLELDINYNNKQVPINFR